MLLLKGRVYSGINNIYRVKDEQGRFFECRIKGKVLQEDKRSYTPLAPGDWVDMELTGGDKGLILERQERKNSFARWNRKKEMRQTVAANVDLLAAVISVTAPPFRPRFVDRVLINAAQYNVPACIVVNKIDRGMEDWAGPRIRNWQKLGYRVFQTSVVSGKGLKTLKNALKGKTAVLFGPSGVGKSSLLNYLVPGAELPVGEISAKYNRGKHVTNFGRLLDVPGGGYLVDTPGVREILVRGIEPEELTSFFPEFREWELLCGFSPCSHRHEPDCGVRDAVESGLINEDRYENYLRIRDELEAENHWQVR